MRAKWSAPDAGERRRTTRFSSARRAARDLRAVERLLAVHAPRATRILDVPSGDGRLAPALVGPGRTLVACDVSASMLVAAAGRGHEHRVRADALRLPFPTHSFDAVVCCRLLHHFEERALLVEALAELLRVARGPVLASYWSLASWPGWRRRLGFSGPDRGGRVERSDADVARAVEGVGGRVLQRVRPAGWFSNQTFAVVGER